MLGLSGFAKLLEIAGGHFRSFPALVSSCLEWYHSLFYKAAGEPIFHSIHGEKTFIMPHLHTKVLDKFLVLWECIMKSLKSLRYETLASCAEIVKNKIENQITVLEIKVQSVRLLVEIQNQHCLNTFWPRLMALTLNSSVQDVNYETTAFEKLWCSTLMGISSGVRKKQVLNECFEFFLKQLSNEVLVEEMVVQQFSSLQLEAFPDRDLSFEHPKTDSPLRKILVLLDGLQRFLTYALNIPEFEIKKCVEMRDLLLVILQKSTIVGMDRRDNKYSDVFLVCYKCFHGVQRLETNKANREFIEDVVNTFVNRISNYVPSKPSLSALLLLLETCRFDRGIVKVFLRAIVNVCQV
jgi:hypothetical protein